MALAKRGRPGYLCSLVKEFVFWSDWTMKILFAIIFVFPTSQSVQFDLKKKVTLAC